MPATIKNCCWASSTAQSRNKRNSVFVVHEGEKKLPRNAMAAVGLNPTNDLRCYRSQGMSPQEAFEYFVERRRPKNSSAKPAPAKAA